VNTAMYDKGEKEDLSEFKQTEYWEAVQNFQKFIVAEGRKGFSPERLGEAVHVALSTAKPKARYAVVKQRFKNWTLPRLLPARMVKSHRGGFDRAQWIQIAPENFPRRNLHCLCAQ